jgi:hypothetical protein
MEARMKTVMGMILLVLAFSGAGEAADAGTCLSPKDMIALLKAEEQRSIAFGNQHVMYEIKPDG